jgi:3'(2'), 5'-bisphosphate nucleotidase
MPRRPLLKPNQDQAKAMDDSDIRSLAEGLLSTVLAVARLQMSHFAAGVTAEIKSDKSPVTIADRESEALILDALGRVAPGIPVVSEEAAADGHVPQLAHRYFLVDPLDGTKPFLRREPHFTINIALIEGRRPVFGVVYAPAIPDFFVTLGVNSACATRLPPSSNAQTLGELQLETLRTRPADPSGVRALTSQSHLNTETRGFLDGYTIADRRAISSSLKFGMLARGEADVYPRVGPTSEWDTAAGHAVLAAAGGTVLVLDGSPLEYGKPRFLNPNFVAWANAPLQPLRR